MTVSIQYRPKAAPAVFVLDNEYDPLADLVCSSPRSTAGIALLWNELDRATIIEAGRAPEDLVRMGCRVTIRDKNSDEVFSVRLVYPTEAAKPDRVSVASGLGAALIGLPRGEEFHWTSADGRRRVIEIVLVEPPLRPSMTHKSDRTWVR